MKEENKKSILELWKDKHERAKIELIFYGIFFVGIIIFVRVMGSMNSNSLEDSSASASFLYNIDRNYQYEITVDINDSEYIYRGKVLENNETINKLEIDNSNYYYVNKDKYYILKDGNYILTTEDEVYDVIGREYFNIDTIKEYLKLGTRKENTYHIKVSDIILNSNSEEEITITVLEDKNSLIIDYTNLLKVSDSTISKATLDIKYLNINNITSLEE